MQIIYSRDATGDGEIAINLCGCIGTGLTGVVPCDTTVVALTGVTGCIVDVIVGVLVAVVLTVLHTECNVFTGAGDVLLLATVVGTDETGAALFCTLPEPPGTVSTSFIPIQALGP